MILGIDPGYSGALAFYNYFEQRLVKVLPMPLLEGERVFSPQTKVEIDVATFARLVNQTRFGLKFAVVEKVDSSPNMGVVSAFRFGQGFGQLQGVLTSLDVPIRYAYPAAWKSAMQLSKNKKDSLTLACKLFPEWAPTFRRDAASADLAEAALLAKFGERFLSKV